MQLRFPMKLTDFMLIYMGVTVALGLLTAAVFGAVALAQRRVSH